MTNARSLILAGLFNSGPDQRPSEWELIDDAVLMTHGSSCAIVAHINGASDLGTRPAGHALLYALGRGET